MNKAIFASKYWIKINDIHFTKRAIYSIGPRPKFVTGFENILKFLNEALTKNLRPCLYSYYFQKRPKFDRVLVPQYYEKIFFIRSRLLQNFHHVFVSVLLQDCAFVILMRLVFIFVKHMYFTLSILRRV